MEIQQKYACTGETILTEAKFETDKFLLISLFKLLKIMMLNTCVSIQHFLKKTWYLLRTEVVFVCLLIADLVSEKQSKILLFVHLCKTFTTVFCTFVSSFLSCSPSFVETNTAISLDHIMKGTFWSVHQHVCLYLLPTFDLSWMYLSYVVLYNLDQAPDF